MEDAARLRPRAQKRVRPVDTALVCIGVPIRGRRLSPHPGSSMTTPGPYFCSALHNNDPGPRPWSAGRGLTAGPGPAPIGLPFIIQGRDNIPRPRQPHDGGTDPSTRRARGAPAFPSTPAGPQAVPARRLAGHRRHAPRGGDRRRHRGRRPTASTPPPSYEWTDPAPTASTLGGARSRGSRHDPGAPCRPSCWAWPRAALLLRHRIRQQDRRQDPNW